MALGATLYHLRIDLSDVDRGVYEALDLRVARHPSETMSYLVTRLLGYCVFYEEGIAFSHGLGATDEPALWIKDLQGNLRAWIEVGAPAADRLHRASKASPRVAIITAQKPDLVTRVGRDRAIHRADDIEVHVIEPGFVSALEAATERNARWELVRSGGQLYATVDGQTLSGAITLQRLAPFERS